MTSGTALGAFGRAGEVLRAFPLAALLLWMQSLPGAGNGLRHEGRP